MRRVIRENAEIPLEIWELVILFISDDVTVCHLSCTSQNIHKLCIKSIVWKDFCKRKWLIWMDKLNLVENNGKTKTHSGCDDTYYQLYKKRYIQEKELFELFWKIVERGKLNSAHDKIGDIERTRQIIYNEYLDIIEKLSYIYDIFANDMKRAFAKIGVYLEDDSGDDSLAYLISLGKQQYERIVKDPTLVEEKEIGSNEGFQYIWRSFNYENELKNYSHWKHNIINLAKEMSDKYPSRNSHPIFVLLK